MSTLNVERLIKSIEKGYEVLERSKDAIEIPALKEAEGSMKRRIHNSGQDSEGNRIGIKSKRGGLYSKGYERRKGKIVGEGNLYPINLQLRGDLLKGYTVGQLQGRNVLEFQDDLSRKKAGRHEENYNTELFKPSQQELEDIQEVWLLGFEEALRDAFGKL